MQILLVYEFWLLLCVCVCPTHIWYPGKVVCIWMRHIAECQSTSRWDFKTERRGNYYFWAQWHHEIFLLQNWFTEWGFIHFCVRKFKDCPVFCVYILTLVPATAFYPEEGTVSNLFQNAYLNCICTVAGILWEALVTNKKHKKTSKSLTTLITNKKIDSR